jgi:hypothetical protein
MSTIDYEHDVFISLAHNSHSLQWLDERFLPNFTPFLADELGRSEKQVDIYVAKKIMAAGTYWPDELAENHARSRTLLALLSRSYRSREYCQIEFSLMKAREARARMREEKRQSLIIPVFIHDGEDKEYRDILDGIEPIDLVRPRMLCCNCMSQKGKDAHTLEILIRRIASVTADAIRDAPPFSDEWRRLNYSSFLALFRKSACDGGQSTVPGREPPS